MTTIILDGLNEEEFRRSIELRLRRGLAGVAIERLRGLLAPYCGPGGILPERFLTAAAADLHFYGWDSLADALTRHDRPGRPVTALSIAFAWPGEELPAPDAEGNLNPPIEVGYYTDESFPFSKSSRDDLLEGYSSYGCSWAGDCVASDSTLSLGGIDDLHGALSALETRLLASEEPDEEEIRAGSLGACLLSALLFQAVDQRIARDGLPRPLCVTAGSNGVYPYFDAPVAGMAEDALKAAEAAELMALDKGLPGPRYSSLLVTSIPRARKRAVLVLDENVNEAATRIASLRGLTEEPADTAVSEQAGPEQPGEPGLPLSGGVPLLAKKAPKPAWDFRDLLSPMSPEPATRSQVRSAPPVPEPEPEPVEDYSNFPAAPEAQPGFTVLDQDPLERLDSLVAAHLPVSPAASEAVATEPADEDAWQPSRMALPSSWADPDPDPQATAPAAIAQSIPPVMAKARQVTSAQPSMWTRIRHWLGLPS